MALAVKPGRGLWIWHGPDFRCLRFRATSVVREAPVLC